jgi:hypothetical protein
MKSTEPANDIPSPSNTPFNKIMFASPEKEMVRLDACAFYDDNISMQGIKLVETSAEEYSQRIARMSDERLVQEGESAR